MMPKRLLRLYSIAALIGVGTETALAQCGATQSTNFYLQFPLGNRSAYSAVVNTAFDHSMTADYGTGKDNVVVAFTGERGDNNCSVQPCSSFGATIGGVNLYAFRNSRSIDCLFNAQYSGGT